MKRISFFLAFICLTLLSFGQVSAQSVTLESVSPLYAPDTIACGPGFVEIYLRVQNQGPKVTGSTNGFSLISPNGATWDPWNRIDTTIAFGFPPVTTIDTVFYGRFVNPVTISPVVWKGTDPQIYDGGVFVPSTCPAIGTRGADTLAFGGFAQQTGIGIITGFNEISWRISFMLPCPGNNLKTICLDSAFMPPTSFWAWSGDAGALPSPTWDGPHCWTIFEVPDAPPELDCNSISDPTNFNHCAVATVNLSATDAEPDYPLTWSTNVGTIVNVNGNGTSAQLVFTAPAGSKAGCTTATVTVEDSFGLTDDCTFDLCWTNNPPTLTGCNDTTIVGRGNSATNDVNGADNDACDVAGLVYSINSVTPPPVGTYSINSATGEITFNTVFGDANPNDQLFTFNVCVTDGAVEVCCDVFFNVLAVEPFEITIEKTHGTIQGGHEMVDVTLTGGSLDIGGFDIVLAYDASALNFIKAIPGSYFYGPGSCLWEYFTYRFSAFGNCGSICPSGLLRVTGIAEQNNGPAHPICFTYTPDEVLFTLDFLVTNDRTMECSYVPIRFVWFDCGDNTLSSKTGDSLYISRFVYEFDLGGEITNNNYPYGYPTYAGAQNSDCFIDPIKHPYRFIDFFNGGVDIACAESLDARGDINLNEIPNEIADAVLFSRYFVYGLGVFVTNLQGQIAATDVNADGLALSVADLVYQIRIIVGDANPFPKLSPVEATYTIRNGVISVDTKLGAAFIEVEGQTDVTALTTNMETEFAYNAESNTTRILVYAISRESFEGEFIQVNGNVLNIEMATYEGAPVVARKLPTDFALNQNYPNPFNPSTTISFSLPTRSDISLTIHNVTGQKVAEFSGTYEAGEQTIVWDATQFASGIYFYRLTTDNFSETKEWYS